VTVPVAWRARAAQLVRYGSVSVIATTTSLTVLVVLVASKLVAAAAANVVATFAGMVPSFELNRRWVWRATGRPSLRREIVPFAALSLTGLVLSTGAVQLAAMYTAAAGWAHPAATAAVALANLAAFGVVWIAQFVVLDRVLFRTDPRSCEGASEQAQRVLTVVGAVHDQDRTSVGE
jgi:putative flippase GtrA